MTMVIFQRMSIRPRDGLSMIWNLMKPLHLSCWAESKVFSTVSVSMHRTRPFEACLQLCGLGFLFSAVLVLVMVPWGPVKVPLAQVLLVAPAAVL